MTSLLPPGCGGIFHAREGNFSTRGFPSTNYQTNVECLWTIVVSDGYHIQLAFVEQFDLETSVECASDFVQVKWHLLVSLI